MCSAGKFMKILTPVLIFKLPGKIYVFCKII